MDEKFNSAINHLIAEHTASMLKMAKERKEEVQALSARSEYWKAEHLAGNKVIDELRARVAELEALVESYNDWFDAHSAILANHRIGGYSFVEADGVISMRSKDLPISSGEEE